MSNQAKKFILGTKIAMSQLFAEDGTVTPITLIQAEPMTVTQVKTVEKDGYRSVQVGSGTSKKVSKAKAGHLKDLPSLRRLKEFALGDAELNRGDKIDLSIFAEGDIVKVTGISKGKGFQGGVKRHGFHGMPASHGHHHVMRHPGSIGQRFPQHTLKGTRMAGHMGSVQITTRGLKVMKIDAENNLIAVKGAVPGRRGTLLEIVTIK